MVDFTRKIAYTGGVTEKASRIFYLTAYLLLSTQPTFGINPLALRDTKANAAEVGFFISQRENRATLAGLARFSGDNSMYGRILAQHKSPVNNLIGGAS